MSTIVRAGVAGGLIIFLGAFAAGRMTAPAGPAEPELRPASSRSAPLQLPQLADAAPLPGLAAAVASPPRRATAPAPAPAPAKRKSGTRKAPVPVVIVGSG
jgi:hypothetical protein